jgi:hypothetical protein
VGPNGQAVLVGDPAVVIVPRPRLDELVPQPAPGPDPVAEIRGPAGGVVSPAPDVGARFTPDPVPAPIPTAADTFDPPVPVLRPGPALKVAAPPPPPPAPAGPPPDAQTSTTGPVTVHFWPRLGLIGATLAGRPWVTVRWPARSGREPISVDVVISESGPQPAIGLKVRVGAAIKVLVNREAEQSFAASVQARIRFAHRYSAGGRPVEINEELPDGTSRATVGTDFTDDRDQGEEPEYDIELGAFRPGPPAPQSELFAWRFDTRAQLDAWAAAHPLLWWVEGPPDGPTLQAMHADEKRMQWLAGEWRVNEEDLDVRTVYEKGVAWESPDPLWDLFYVSQYGAQEGPPGDAGECLVFRHDGDSFGRVPLSHEDALAAWLDLEAGGLAAPSLAGRLPRGELAYVAAKGGGSSVHLIGADYLQRRAHFFAGIRAKRDLDTLLGEDGVWWGYLRIALDRTMGRADPALRTAFDYTSGLWDAAGRRALPDIAADAKQEAIYSVQGAMNGVGVYCDLDAVKRLVMSMPGMTNKARHDSITFLGFEGMDVCDLAHPLADRETAALVWMGQTVGKVSLEVLRGKAVEQFENLRKFRDQIEYGEAEPLWDSGEFGRAIRERVYKKRGFTLSGRFFPHEDVPHRMATKDFGGTELGYAFAVGASNEHSRRQRKKYLTILAVVVATVLLVLIANAAGAMVAGMLFTEGTLAFMATEVVVGAVLVTAAGPAVSTLVLSGGTADAAAYEAAYAHWDRDLFWNVVSFGVLKALSTGVRSAILVSAGVKEFDQLGRGWKAAEIMSRASLSGLAMYGLTGLRMRLEGKPMPEGEERNEMIFEMGLSLVLMEFAGFAVSRPMKELSKFAREVRLGDQAAKMDALLITGQGLARETALYAAEPGVAGRSGATLLARQIQFLEAARAIVAKLKSSVRTRVDGERLAARLAPFEEMIGARLDLAADFELMSSTRLRPASLAEGNREFTYERGKSADLEAYYKSKGATVRTDGDTIFVTLDGKDLILRPQVAAGVRPDGSRVPEALDTWRLDLSRRRTKLLADATDRASADADVRKVRDADPFTMDAKALTALETALARAATRLAKVPAQPLGPIDRSGTDSAGWRTRLAGARQALLAQAEILGIGTEPEIAALRGRGRVIGRKNLADNTLAVQQELVEAAQKVVDRFAGAQRSLADAAAAMPGPDIAALQTGLEARQADVRRRADIYGVKPGTKYLEAVKGMRPGKRAGLEGLREAEAVLEAAEARLDAMARRALADAEATHGKGLIDEIRADPEFALWTDAQIGDALRAFGGSRNPKGFRFSAQALRGTLWAAVPEGPGSTRSPIGFEGARGFAGGPEDLTFVLETYGLMRDLGIEGSFAVLRRAVSTRDNFKGAVWQMEVARNAFGLENVKAFEFVGSGREVDILLKDGRRVETKDWKPATWDPPKVRKQMTADLEGATDGGTRPDGIKDIFWLFRSPPPRPVSTIRSTLRGAFDTWLAGKRATLTPEQIADLRTAFDAHADLVQAPDVSRTGVIRPPPQRGTGVPPRARDEETKAVPPVLVAP